MLKRLRAFLLTLLLLMIVFVLLPAVAAAATPGPGAALPSALEELLALELLAFVTVGQALLVVVALIFADALLGIIKAFTQGEGKIELIPKFLATNILPYAGGLLIFAALTMAYNYLAVPFLAFAGLVGLKYLKEFIVKLLALFGFIF